MKKVFNDVCMLMIMMWSHDVDILRLQTPCVK